MHLVWNNILIEINLSNYGSIQINALSLYYLITIRVIVRAIDVILLANGLKLFMLNVP